MSSAEGLTRLPIDAEELAAFIDGRLVGERRRRVIERLAEDQEAYELYSTVIEVREAMAADATDGPASRVPPATEAGAAVPFPTGSSASGAGRRPRPARWFAGWWRSERSGAGWLPATAAVAVGAAMAVLAGWWVLRPTGSRELLAAFDTRTVSPTVSRGAPERLEPTFRGAEEERAAHFKLGARAFDLALAVEAGDPESSRKWLEEMVKLLEQVPRSWGLPDLYRDLGGRLEAGEPPRSLRRDVARAEEVVEVELDLPERPLFAFGRWLEAVRTAAANGDRRFLASRAAREPLRAFRDASPSPAVATRLEEIGAALGSGAETTDLAAIAQAAKDILAHCADGRPCLGSPLP